MNSTGIEIIRFATLGVQPWKNGAGTTREIARDRADETWDWRISVADVVSEAPFSSFPGIDRILVLLEGEGMTLAFEDGRRLPVLPPFGFARFEGEAALRGVPVQGGTRDFNVMWRRASIAAGFEVRTVTDTCALPITPADTWVVHVAAGAVALPGIGETLERGDTAVVSGAACAELRLAGEGTVFLVCRQPA